PGTSAYVRSVREGCFATAKGHAFSGQDRLRARMIEALMCDFRIDPEEMQRDFAGFAPEISKMFADAVQEFGDMVVFQNGELRIPDRARPLTRMIARSFDAYDLSKAGHSSAV
ncbi:MAG: coproporphyrinogen III oxidase, partial [Albidovulum sp.]